MQITKCICLNCKMYLSKFHNVFVNFIKCRRGAAEKEFIREGCLAKLCHNFAPAASAQLYQVWSKIISTKPNVDLRAFFPLKVVAIHNFLKTKLKQTLKKLWAEFVNQFLIMYDLTTKIFLHWNYSFQLLNKESKPLFRRLFDSLAKKQAGEE